MKPDASHSRLAVSLGIFLSAIMFFSSCKKDERIPKANQVKKSPVEIFATAGRYQDSMSVTSDGLLNFLTVENLEDYRQFVISHTHRQVRAYLDSIGFNSLGESIYGSSVLDNIVTEEEAFDYVWDADRIFEVENLIMKPISESSCSGSPWEFLLVMHISNFNSSSYADLQEGAYDPETMNQFATNPTNQTSTVVEFMNESVAGNQESEANDCPTEEGFLHTGWVSGDPYCNPLPENQWVNWDLSHEGMDPTFQNCHKETWRLFGIGIRHRTVCHFIGIHSCAEFVP